ncbi:MAG: hypothetical protein EAZ15_02845 [Sphingobacteriales bacterium]|nr:MAG: hypothetical protein EAZ15_02845 [Sphingobacteriales bacterium]
MKKQAIILAMAALVFSATSCKKSKVDEPQVVIPSSTIEVTADITTNTAWSADKIYLLKGIINVNSDATLTIPAGTLIKGDKASKSCLVINRGGKIDAQGTIDKPIVFTSNQPVGARSSGDWGGVILLGKAPNNQALNQSIEGIPTDASGKASYGGTDAADNSGTMKYVRIEFAGVPLSPDNEINGLTFGSVGSGTTIDYIQVNRSGDDSFEWFGGTVNCKHLIAVAGLDDDFDTDFGYSGKIQFALGVRYPNIADVSGSNGFESDNDASGSVKLPNTGAIFSNITLVGPIFSLTTAQVPNSINANYQHASLIRRNSSLSVFNSVLTGFPEGVSFDDSKVEVAKATSNNLVTGRSAFENNIIYGCNTKSNEVKGSNKLDFEVTLRANNTFDATKLASDIYTDAYKYPADIVSLTSGKIGVPDFTLKAASAASSGSMFTNAKIASDTFFEKVDYRGAFGTTNWAAGWANFDPQTMPYDAPGKVNK